MKKAIALITALAFLAGSASWNQPVRAATATEYAILIIFIALVVAVDASELPPSQKNKLIHTINSWKKLPPTKKNLAYIRRNSARIKRLLATINNPKSRLALQRYMTEKNSLRRRGKMTGYGKHNFHKTFNTRLLTESGHNRLLTHSLLHHGGVLSRGTGLASHGILNHNRTHFLPSSGQIERR